MDNASTATGLNFINYAFCDWPLTTLTRLLLMPNDESQEVQHCIQCAAKRIITCS